MQGLSCLEAVCARGGCATCLDRSRWRSGVPWGTLKHIMEPKLKGKIMEMRKHALGLESIVWFHWIPCKVSNLGHRYMFQEVWILFGDLGTWCINRMIAGNNSPKSLFRLYLLVMSSSYIVGILNLFTLHLSGDISIKPCLRLLLVIEGQNLSFIRIYHL
jgi:hypothetical protein